MNLARSYSEYMRFAHDFGLNVSLGLTTIDIGDIYLSTVAVCPDIGEVCCLAICLA